MNEKQFVFSTSNIEEINDRLDKGYTIPRNEKFWFKNFPVIKRADIPFNRTDDEMIEYLKCVMGITNIRYVNGEVEGDLCYSDKPEMTGIQYFAEKYCKIKREDGSLGKLKLRDYQKDILDLYSDNRFSILCSSRQSGKALKNNSLVWTINGKKTIGELTVGEQIFDDEGKLTSVVGVYPQGKKDIYRITFSDDTYVDCCKEHLWTVEKNGSEKTLQLQDFKDDYLNYRGDYKYYIKVAKCVEYTEKELPIEPYSLGILLGDGNLNNGSIKFSTSDNEIVEHFKNTFNTLNIVKEPTKKYDYKITYKNGHKNPLNQILIDLKLKEKSDSKFIPYQYLISSKEQRVALLQGLLDSDGSCDKKNKIEFSTISKQLSLDFQELCNSLGIKTYTRERITSYTYKGIKKQGKISYRTSLYLSDSSIIPFRLERKQSNVRYEKHFDWSKKRGIKNIELIGFDECTCISVDNESKLFLTNNFIPTHNTVSAAITILHYCIFNNDKTIMIVANKIPTVVEICDKIKSIYYLLPWFLKPGVVNWNQGSMVFDTGCRIRTSAATKTAAVGFTIDLLYLDEFAFIPKNIINDYYRSVFPTVSAVNNSKIIITSTPNGMNLFYKLLTDAERPVGDKLKNNFKSLRVYWWQVPNRYVSYIKLDPHSLNKYNIKETDVLSYIESLGFNCSLIYSQQNLRYEIHIPNKKEELPLILRNESGDNIVSDYLRTLTIQQDEHTKFRLTDIADISSWKEDAIKDIGGEDKFNQEFALQFIAGNKALFDSQVMNKISNEKRNFKYLEIPLLNEKTYVPYDDLRWIDNPEIFNIKDIKSYNIVMSVDLAEGLGGDYSVINIFRLMSKNEDEISSNIESIYDCFKLVQIGLYTTNIRSVPEVAELLYLISFDLCNPDLLGVVLEVNAFGGELIQKMKDIFGGRNNYGSYIFFRYKHRQDAVKKEIGIKLRQNKNIFVREYQKRMRIGDITVHEESTIHQITTFIKKETNAGNIQFEAESGHDDIIMTVVEVSTVFENNKFHDMITRMFDTLPEHIRTMIQRKMGEIPAVRGVDYSILYNAQRSATINNRYNNPQGGNPYGGSYGNSNNNYGW